MANFSETNLSHYFNLQNASNGKKICELDGDSVEWKSLLCHYGEAVYVIQCQDLYKIGITVGSIENRLNTLQTANPFELKLVYAVKTQNCKELESLLHNKFSANRERGEWFKLSEQDFVILDSFVEEYLNSK